MTQREYDVNSIRAMTLHDLDQVMELWLNTNLSGHAFIDQTYWQKHVEEVKKMLPYADVIVYEKQGRILGFLGIQKGYLAGIFVDENHQSMGIGKRLLEYAKGRYPSLTLHVYEKNQQAIAFYQREGFTFKDKSMEQDTGEMELFMEWRSRNESI